MFTQFRNIDTAFKHVKRFTILFIAFLVLVCGLVVWKCFAMVSAANGKIYILANGKALEAVAAERKDNIGVELRDHIKMFHHYFFTLDPDEKVIQRNVTSALYLADESAKKAYDNLKEQGYYTNLISANISQSIDVDSVVLDLDVYPYAFRCYATQGLVRSTSTVSRKLVTEGFLRNVSRSDNNPHGFLIQRWETVSNVDVVEP
ncbi:MAG: conjugative transposon protein TraK [Pedobacter sp.]|nr:conjugative transposon protein TraK [Pedobacter sp.]